ncbi:MAG: hypothetical protein ACYDHP_12140 [Ferrimicrobium sp.]
MAEEFNPHEIVERFRLRAAAVKSRQIPPIEGQDRRYFIEQAKNDFFDYSLIADANVTLADGILTFQVDLRSDQAQ